MKYLKFEREDVSDTENLKRKINEILEINKENNLLIILFDQIGIDFK